MVNNDGQLKKDGVWQHAVGKRNMRECQTNITVSFHASLHPWGHAKRKRKIDTLNSSPEHLFLPKTPIHKIPKKDIPRVAFITEKHRNKNKARSRIPIGKSVSVSFLLSHMSAFLVPTVLVSWPITYCFSSYPKCYFRGAREKKNMPINWGGVAQSKV